MTMVACPEIPRAVEAQSWAVYSLNINALMSPGWRQAKQPRQEQEVAGSRFFVCLFAFFISPFPQTSNWNPGLPF